MIPDDHPIAERDKIAFGINGVLPMTAIGIIASISKILADVKVPVFVISTYDTDWFIVDATKFDSAKTALESVGH